MHYFCRHCQSEYPPAPELIKCQCGSSLWVKHESEFTRADLIPNDFTMWRYSTAYPLNREEITISFNETITPLAKTQIAGVPVLVKMDSLMPTGSFKARGAALVVNYLNNQGVNSIAEDSSGNGGAAYAGYAAKGGLACHIYVPKGTSAGKTVQTRVYGARCIEVSGSRNDVAVAAMNSIQTDGGYYVGHNWHPLFIEGVKSIAYEIWEQCGYQAPDNFVVPAGNGSLLAGAYLGFSELLRNGEISKMPRLFGVQTHGIQPFVQCFNDQAIEIGDTDTLAEGIKIQRSSHLEEIIGFVRESNGGFLSVGEDQIKVALYDMGSKGFFIEPTSATAFAGIASLIEDGRISTGDTTVGVITGHGLKATGTIRHLLEEDLSGQGGLQ
ncbi:pyridoxal-phosphate dependent enzyme [Endozoicomonas sp. SCSIO W0465]|uniref:threonine synthase n=1 Tax=Endozoicomonas sp. SCSIO W0465 TaxID=2918516 RepID=UPI002075CDA3|nr:pyridoxal-phosphate dependent enzyme [Endozoicomonas sp. SCSIO W0465]USE34326.1 pyridoxal-phosphate dependent enzyme [Endozoicomonas sp. SCSIO W0465]